MAAAAEQADLGESSNSSHSGVAVTLPDRADSLDVLSWPRPSSSEEHLPYPWQGSHPPTHPLIKHTQISYVESL